MTEFHAHNYILEQFKARFNDTVMQTPFSVRFDLSEIVHQKFEPFFHELLVASGYTNYRMEITVHRTVTEILITFL